MLARSLSCPPFQFRIPHITTSSVAQPGIENKFRPLVYDFIGPEGSMSYTGRKKYFRNPSV